MDGWKEGWMDGWMEAKAGLRIAYSNKKIQNTLVDINNDLNMNGIAKDIKQKYK